jgi:hypothetical protein
VVRADWRAQLAGLVGAARALDAAAERAGARALLPAQPLPAELADATRVASLWFLQAATHGGARLRLAGLDGIGTVASAAATRAALAGAERAALQAAVESVICDDPVPRLRARAAHVLAALLSDLPPPPREGAGAGSGAGAEPDSARASGPEQLARAESALVALNRAFLAGPACVRYAVLAAVGAVATGVRGFRGSQLAAATLQHWFPQLSQTAAAAAAETRPALRARAAGLRAASIECASALALAAGREAAAARANELAALLHDEELRREQTAAEEACAAQGHMLGAWAAVAELLGKDLAPFLPTLMPTLLEQAGRAVLYEHEDEHDEGSGGVGVGAPRTSEADDKAFACAMVLALAKSLGAAFAPYGAETLRVARRILAEDWETDARCNAAAWLPHVAAAAEPGEPRRAALSGALRILLAQLDAEGNEPELDKHVVAALRDCLVGVAAAAPASSPGAAAPASREALLSPKELEAVCASLVNRVRRSLQKREVLRAELFLEQEMRRIGGGGGGGGSGAGAGAVTAAAAAAAAAAAVDDQQLAACEDEDTGVAFARGDADEEDLRFQIVECFERAAKALGPALAPAYLKCLHAFFVDLAAPERLFSDRFLAVFLIDGILAGCGTLLAAPAAELAAVLVANAEAELAGPGALGARAELLQGCAFGMSLLARLNGHEAASIAARAAHALVEIVRRCDEEQRQGQGQEQVAAAAANAGTALGAMLRHCSAALATLDCAALAQVWLQAFPFPGDRREVVGAACDLVAWLSSPASREHLLPDTARAAIAALVALDEQEAEPAARATARELSRALAAAASSDARVARALQGATDGLIAGRRRQLEQLLARPA